MLTMNGSWRNEHVFYAVLNSIIGQRLCWHTNEVIWSWSDDNLGCGAWDPTLFFLFDVKRSNDENNCVSPWGWRLTTKTCGHRDLQQQTKSCATLWSHRLIYTSVSLGKQRFYFNCSSTLLNSFDVPCLASSPFAILYSTLVSSVKLYRQHIT